MGAPYYHKKNLLHRKPKRPSKVITYPGTAGKIKYNYGAISPHTTGGAVRSAKFCSICGDKLPKAEKDRIGGTCKDCLNSPEPSRRRKEILGI